MIRAAATLALALAATGAHADACDALMAQADRIGELRDRDAAAGIAAAEAGIDDARTAGCVEAQAEMHAALADSLNVAGRRDESLAEYRRATGLLEPFGETKQLAAVLRREAITHASGGDYTTAVGRALESYRISIALDDAGEAAMSASNIGTLYSRLLDFDRAREYFERAHDAFIALGNRVSAAGIGINLGSLLMRQADQLVARGDDAGARALRERALAYSLDSIAQFEAIGHTRGVTMAASNAGTAHNLLGDHEAALPLHRRSLALREQVGDRDGLTASHIHLAQSYIPLGRFDDAERHLESASDLAADRSLMLQLGVAEKWVELEEARGNAREALARMRELNSLREERVAADHQARVAAIQAQFDSAAQEREIDTLRYEQQIAGLRLERQRAWLAGGTVLVALLIVALVGMYGWQRLTHRHTRDMELAARSDELTGLPNRRGVRDRIAYEIRRSRRSGRPFALAVIDVDGFKAINDRYGHEDGDRLLVMVAERVVQSLRQQDTLARWGGDELLILLPETDEKGGITLARKVAASLSGEPFGLRGDLHTVTLTVGVAQYWPGQTMDECIRAADDAMYRGKKTGRNKVVGSREDVPGISYT